MADPKRPAGTFVSPYKRFSVKPDEQWASYVLAPRSGDYLQTGCITKDENGWYFYPSLNVIRLDHIDLLDIAACIKVIEKREQNPNLYKK